MEQNEFDVLICDVEKLSAYQLRYLKNFINKKIDKNIEKNELLDQNEKDFILDIFNKTSLVGKYD